MFKPLKNYTGTKIISEFDGFVRKLYESKDYDINEVRQKMIRAQIWLNIKKGFYGQLLGELNIYGAKLNPPTMCTDGSSIIFDPRFVAEHSEKIIRLVLAHEILHCIGEHQERRKGRDPLIWNYACDYAINPLLLHDDAYGNDWEFPKTPEGDIAGLYEKEYEGMVAEDIYDILIANPGLIKKIKDMTNDIGHVSDWDEDMPEGEDGLEIQINEEQEDGEDKDRDGKENNKEALPSVGQKIRTNDGKEGIIKVVHPNGDIEI